MSYFEPDEKNGYRAFHAGIPVYEAPLYSSPHCYYWLQGWQKAFDETKTNIGLPAQTADRGRLRE